MTFTGIYDSDGRSRRPDEHACADRIRPCKTTDTGLEFNKELTTDDEKQFAEDVNSYFSERFAAPIRDDEGRFLCLHCGTRLTGSLVDQLLNLDGGGFTWGLAHGEGHCRLCSWPARAYHFAKDREGKDLFTLRNVVLQYLPADPKDANAVSD